jgi:hypothetical protein
MSKFAKTIIFISPYSIGQFESWLSDMAKKGKVFQSIRSGVCIFEKTDPQDLEYRVEIYKDNFSYEALCVYEESGWKYVSRVKDAHIFSAPSSSAYTEIHTDATEQSYTLKDLKRKIQSLVALFCLIFLSQVAIAGAFLSGAFLDIGNLPTYNFFIYGDAILFPVSISVFLLLLLLVQALDFFALKRRLYSGRPISHHMNWKGNMTFQYIINAIFILLGFFSIVNSAISCSNSGIHEKELTAKSQLPVPSLSAIEERDDLDYFNGSDATYEMRRGILITISYDVRELALEKNGSGEGAIIYSKYYEIAIPFLAEAFASDLLTYETSDDPPLPPGVKPINISFEGLDRVTYLPTEMYGYFSIVAVKDNRVLFIEYNGETGYMKVLEEVADALS